MMTEEYVKPKKRVTKKEPVTDVNVVAVAEEPKPVPKNFPMSAPNSSLAQRN